MPGPRKAPAPTPQDDLARLYADKAHAERAEADSLDPAWGMVAFSGPGSAAILLLKGEAPGRLSVAVGPLSPAELEAARRALAALGLPADDLVAMGTRVAGEPDGSDNAVRRLALAVEACDPAWVIALDSVAGTDAANVLEVDRLAMGRPLLRAGRVWLVVDGLEASLTDPARKRRVWAQFKALADVGAQGREG